MSGLWSKREDFAVNFIAAAVFIVIVAIAITVWAAFESLPNPIIFFIFVGMLAFGAMLFVEAPDLWRRYTRPRSPRAWEKTLRDWLYDAGYKPDRKDSPDVDFHIVGTDHQGREIHFVMFPKEPGVIRISVTFKMKWDAGSQEKMSKEALEAVASVVLMQLTSYGVLQTGIQAPFDAVELFVDVLADESLTRFVFFEKVNYMRNAKILIDVAMYYNMSAQLTANHWLA